MSPELRSSSPARTCCRKGDPFWGLRVGSCLTVGNELSEETHELTLSGRGAGRRAAGGGNPGEGLCHVARYLGFYADGIHFWLVSGQSFQLRVLPGGAHMAQPRWTPARRILGGGSTHGPTTTLFF